MPSLYNDYNSGNDYGSGNDYDSENDNGSGNDKINHTKIMDIVSIVMPLIIFSMFLGIGIFMCISNVFYKCKRKIKTKTEQNEDIKNNKLTKKCINKLNKENKKFIDKECECSICLESFDKNNDKNLVYLKCKHVFHKNCLQKWVGSQCEENNIINCPLCRDTITKQKTLVPIVVYSDSDNESLSDFLD